MPPSYIEPVGYAASFFVAISLTMTNVWRLRWINLLGALLFCVYGLSKGAAPVWTVNAFIAVINVWFLRQMIQQREFFGYVEASGRLLDKFLEYYKDELERFFPGVSTSSLAGTHSFFILRNLRPVGLFVYRPAGASDLEILLDFVAPEFRDLQNAEYLFGAQEHLASQGFRRWITRTQVPEHRSYLERIGFRLDPSEPTLLTRAV